MATLAEVVVSAPGKVILHGEHSVLYRQLAIAGSLGVRTTMVLKEIETTDSGLLVNIHLPSVKLNTTLSIDHIKDHLFQPSTNGLPAWRKPTCLHHEKHLNKVDNCLQAITHVGDLNNIQRNSLRGFLYILSGIFGDTNLLNRSLDIRIDSGLTVGAGTGSSASFAVCLAGALIQLLKIKNGNHDREYSDEDKQLISAWALNCEKIMHGTPSVDTKVSRETKVLVSKVASTRERNLNAVNCIVEACGHIATSAFNIMQKLSTSNSEDSESYYQHLSLWDMNHNLLASLGVSHPSLEDVRASATKFGLASKLTGAGGGGYAIVLVPPTTKQAVIEGLTKELEEKGYSVKDTQLGGPGVVLDHTNP